MSEIVMIEIFKNPVIAIALFAIGILTVRFLWMLAEFIFKGLFHKKSMGTKESCGDCLSWVTTMTNIPTIIKNQNDLRNEDLPNMKTQLGTINTNITSLDERVKKLFNLLEQSWMQEIKELRTALRKKNAELVEEKNK